MKADKPKVVKSKSKKSVKNKDISNDNNTSNEYRQPGLKMSIKARLRTAITSFIIQGYSTCGSNNYCSFSNSNDIIDAFRKIANALVTVNRLFVSLSNGILTMKVDPNIFKIMMRLEMEVLYRHLSANLMVL